MAGLSLIERTLWKGLGTALGAAYRRGCRCRLLAQSGHRRATDECPLLGVPPPDLMARSAIQLVARHHGAVGKNLKEEIDDLASKGLILPVMQEWAHEVRELGNDGTHPIPGSAGTSQKDAKDVVEFLSFLMRVMYTVPHQIAEYRKRKT